jgi:hypothetical protein
MWKKAFVGSVVVMAALVLFMSKNSRSGTASGTGSCHTVTQTNVTYGATVDCPAGEYLSGGGASCAGTDSFLVGSHPMGNGWKSMCQSVKTGGQLPSVLSQAICCKP